MFEMTSALPNRRYGNALRRLGFGDEATDFYDEHVEADAVHENIAAYDLAGGLARQEPELAADILFGARALLFLEDRFGQHLLEAWEEAAPRCVDRWSAPSLTAMSETPPASAYVLPLRWAEPGPIEELSAYLALDRRGGRRDLGRRRLAGASLRRARRGTARRRPPSGAAPAISISRWAR